MKQMCKAFELCVAHEPTGPSEEVFRELDGIVFLSAHLPLQSNMEHT